MALFNKTDPDALKRLREKVEKEREEEKQRKNNTTTTKENISTSSATKSTTPTLTNKSDPAAVQGLREKVAKDRAERNNARTTPSWSSLAITPTYPYTAQDKKTSFATETKNAYTKYASNQNATISSNMTEEERVARIKEIDTELNTLDKAMSGYSRAKAYGSSKALEEAEEKGRARIAELTEEKKKLERVGTFSASEMKQFEIDDAKKKVSAMRNKVQSYGQRPSANDVEAYGQANSELFKAQEELDVLERQKSLYDDIAEFGDVVNNDDFWGQWRANYRSTDIFEKKSKAFSEYMGNPTDENREIAMAYEAFAQEYLKNNEKALDDEGQSLPLLSKNFSSYLAQKKGEAGTAIPLGAFGATLGGLMAGGAGVKAGWTTGYSLGAGMNSYSVIRGSVFSELISYGLDEETAYKMANDDALIEAIIESGETAKDWVFMLSGRGAGKAAGVASKATNKAAKAAVHPALNFGLNVGKGMGLNAISEYTEEGLQGAVGRATREKALSILESEMGQYGKGNIDLTNRPIYENEDGTISTVDSITVQIDDKFVLLPSIIRDENGNPKRLEETDDIVAHYVKTGEHLGEFDTLEEANAYAEKLHHAQAYTYSNNTTVDASDNILVGSAKVVDDALFGGNTEALQELHAQGMEGAKTSIVGGGIQGTVKTIVSAYATARTVQEQNKVVDAVFEDEESLNALIEEGKASGEGTVSNKIATEIETAREKGEEVTREQVRQLIASNDVYIAEEEKSSQPDTLEKAARDVVESRNTPQTAKTEPISNVPVADDSLPTQEKTSLKSPSNVRRGISLAEQLEVQSKNNEPIAVADVKRVTKFGDEGAKLVTELANNEGVTFSQAERAVETAYLSGMTNVDGAKVNFATDTQINAFTAGKKDRAMQDLSAQENAKNATVYDGAFTENEYTKNYTEAEKKMISIFVKGLKMDISAVDEIIASTTIENGVEVNHYANAEHEDGKMRISSRTKKILYQLVMHEGGHRMKQLSPTEFGVLMDALYARAERLGRRAEVGYTQGMGFDKVKAEHDRAGIELSNTSSYIEEIAVRELETIFGSAEEFNKWYDEISGNQQVKNAWDRFVAWLSEIIEDIKRNLDYAKMTKEERAEAKEALAEVERIKDLLANTFKASEKAAQQRANEVKTKQSAETNSTKNLEIKTNQDYNRNISYSMYVYPKLSKAEWALLNDSLEIGLRNNDNYITKSVKWLFSSKNGVKVFSIYGIGDGTEATPFLAVGGKQADAYRDGIQKFLEGNNNGNIRDRTSVNRRIESLLIRQGETSNNLSNFGNRGTKTKDGEVYNGKRGSNRGRTDSSGTENSGEVSFSLQDKYWHTDLNRTQIKEVEKELRQIDNANPTSNPDINFSLMEPVEETKNLIAVHNATEEKLLNALKLGGMPSPSIAITKKDMSHEKFGDISLVFRKNTISPTDRRNKIYSGDAYTPTGVRVEYDVDDDVLQEFNKRLQKLTSEWTYERLPSVDAGTAEVENDSLFKAYERNDRAKLAFLREKGKAPKMPMRTPTLSTFVSNDTVIALAKAFSAKQLSDIANTSEGLTRHKNAFLKIIRDTEDSRVVEMGIYSADAVHHFDIAETARVAASLKENKYKIKKEVDGRKTYELIDKKFTKALKAEYREWIEENTKNAIIDKGIRNNRDLFAPSGKRRSFKQLHEPYNLSNIIKQMFSGSDKGVALFGGSPIGAAQHEYSSIIDVKADSGRLQQLEQEEYDKIRNDIESDVLELARKMQIRSDVFAVKDLLSEAIGKKTKQQADSYLKRESQGWANYSPEFTNELWDIREQILNMPTEYFEAKPQRAVNFDEVALAVLPKGKTALRKQLEDAGVQKVVYYDKGVEGDRLKKINSVTDAAFSLMENDSTTSKDTKQLLDTIEHLKNEFKVTKFAKADPKKLSKMTRELLKEYSSRADVDETFKTIDELYQYLANGEEGHPAVWEDVYNKAYDAAYEIIRNSLMVVDFQYQEYKSLRDYLRKTPMKFDSRYDSVPTYYETFNELRKANYGRLNFTKDGTSIDSVYQELAELYPEFFDAEGEMNSADQLERIVDVLDSLKPTEINPYSRGMEQATAYLANDIIDRFFDIPQAKPTFADKAERRVVEARIKGGKKVEAVRQQRDDKVKKLIESQREKTKKQLDKLRKQRDDKVKKEQEKRRNALSKMSEKQKTKVLRAQIMRHASDLSRKLVSPTDNQHIPHELQGVVAKLLECINLESNYTYDTENHSYKKNDEGLPTRRTQAFNELKKLYAEMASSVVVDPDLMGDNGLLSDVISLADKRIADMNSSELTAVWQTMRAIEASVSTANKMFSEGKYATILDVAEKLRESNKGKKEKTELKGILGKGKTLTTLNMLTPETYFHFLGDAGDSIFRMMRDAQDKHISIMKEVADFTHKTLKGVDVNSLEKKTHTVKLGGEDVTLTTAQLMELYVLMKREQAIDHILVGGILPDVTNGKGMKLNTKVEPIRNLTTEEISAAVSKLTDEQKKIADELQKFVSTVLSEYGNEASMKVYNYEKFLEKNYWPIRTNKQEIASDIGKDTAVTTVANKGMAKGTKPHANTSVRIGSIFDTFAAHSSDMATYAAWLGTTEDVNRIRNFVFWENGVRTGTVKGILDTVHGLQGSKYLEKLLTDISIGVKGTDNMSPFDKLIGSYKAASVGANIRVVIQQPTAIIRALDMINARYLTAGTAHSVIHPLKGWNKAKKYAPIAQWKDWGHFDINTGRQMKDVLFDNASLFEKTKQVGMWGASMADSLAWGQLWNAVEAETKSKHKDLKVGSEEFYETVAKRFTEIVDHTQVVDGILQRSQIMRSPDALTKMATSFMGEPTKQYNMAAAAAYDAKNLKGDAKKKAVARLGRTAVSLAVAGIINACAQSIVDAIRDDDKEKDYWEKWLANFGVNALDTVNVLNYIPYIKDAVSILSGYSVTRMDTAALEKVNNAVKNMYTAVTGTGKYTIAEASAQLFAEIARLYGLPVANVKRDIKSLAMSMAIETDSYLMQYRMEKAMLDINYSGNSKNFMDILFNAYNNDREAYEYIYNDLLSSGYDEDKIQSGMETRMKKAEGVEKASELSKRYMSPTDERKYDSSLRKVKSSQAWKSANSTQKKNAEADLYSFLTSTTDEMKQTRAEAKKYGVDETEYTLWQLAIEMADQPKGQEGNGSYDYSEKAEAINLLNLSDEEIAYFIGKGLIKSAKEELNEALDKGIDMQEYVNFKAATSEMKADKDANGKSINGSKKNKVVNYLNNANLTSEEWDYFYYEVMNYKN